MKRAQKSHSPLLFYSLLSSSLRSLVTQTRTGSKSHGHAKSTTLCIRGRLIRGGAASYTIRLNWRAVSGAKISGPDSRLIYFAILHMGQTIPNSLGVAKVLRKSNLPVIHIVSFAAFSPLSKLRLHCSLYIRLIRISILRLAIRIGGGSRPEIVFYFLLSRP